MHAETVFWGCAAVLFYTYAGYPLLALLQSELLPRRVTVGPYAGHVSVLIAVHNDAARLIPKLKGLLAVRRSECIREVLVGSDGSSDGIGEAIRSLCDTRIRLLEFSERRGKAAVLNQLMTLADADVVVLTDARQPLAHDALDHLLEPFTDPRVGVVSGHLVLRSCADPNSAAKGIGTYWGYEKMIRRWESRSGSVPGATGALYAIRRSLLFPIDPNTILDDVMIPMQAMERGARCIFAPGAICFDEPSLSSHLERIRKRRTMAGVLQVALMRPDWLLPWGHPLWLRFVSHKLMRLLTPFLFAALLASNAYLCTHGHWRMMLTLQLIGWSTGIIGLVLERHLPAFRLLAIPATVISMNVAALQAWSDALRGRFTPLWRRT